jgi:hypothetical protein
LEVGDIAQEGGCFAVTAETRQLFQTSPVAEVGFWCPGPLVTVSVRNRKYEY